MAIAASFTASDSVGWPWQDRAMSSVDAPYSIAWAEVEESCQSLLLTTDDGHGV